MLFLKPKRNKRLIKRRLFTVTSFLLLGMMALVSVSSLNERKNDTSVLASAPQSEGGVIGYGIVTASVLNVRDGASTQSRILGKLNKGTRVKIGFKKGNFYNIFYGNNGGWVSADYVNFNEPISQSNGQIASKKKSFNGSAFNGSSQIITVTNSYKGSKYATVNAYEKVNGQWNLVYSNMSSLIGQNGMEYDSYRRQSTRTTPSGIYNIKFAFGWGGNPGTKIPFRVPDSNSYWDLNSGSSTYNRWIQWNPGGDYEHLQTEWFYKYAMVLDYNWSQKPGKGGAIFIHISPRLYTGGCVGLSELDLVKVMKWLDPAKNPKVLICPNSDLAKYYY